MDRLREEFLARAAFAEDEHRGVAPRDGFGLLDDLHERGRIPKDAVKRVHGPSTRRRGAANPRIRRASRNVSTTQASLVRDMAEKKQDSEPDSKGNCAS